MGGCLSEAPTQYPEAAREHFSRERGNLHHTYIDELIDVQLIADLTEAVGRLIYGPFVLFFHSAPFTKQLVGQLGGGLTGLSSFSSQIWFSRRSFQSVCGELYEVM